MSKPELNKLMVDALVNRGISFFANKMMEEMGELTQVLCKYQNLELGDDVEDDILDKIREELGHVLAFGELLTITFDKGLVLTEKTKRIERFKKYCK